MGDFSQKFVDSQLFWHANEETMAPSEYGQYGKVVTFLAQLLINFPKGVFYGNIVRHVRRYANS